MRINTTYDKTQREVFAKECEKNVYRHFAIHLLSWYISQYNIENALEVGCGTGYFMKLLTRKHPNVKFKGIEMDPEFVDMCQKRKLDVEIGDACNISEKENSFDLVFSLGVLHHVITPSKAISEYLRVSNKAILISDSNKYGQGEKIKRIIKIILYFIRLEGLVEYIRTNGKYYHYSEGDGFFYSYSPYKNLQLIKKECKEINFHVEYNTKRCLYLPLMSPRLILFGLLNGKN